MAASTAYFSFFSLFPLLLGVIAGASFFLDSEEIRSHLDKILTDTLPGSAAFVTDNIDALIRLRGAAGVASIVGLFWSAGKMFGALSRGINRALGLTRTHPFFLTPLRSFLMALMVMVLLFLAVAVSTVVKLLAKLDLGPITEGFDGFLRFAGSHVTGYVLVFVTFGLLYKLVPYERLSWREILPGALFATLLFEFGKEVFVFYLDNVAHLEALYGSVSSIIVLLLWLYFSARVLLLGSEIIAVYRQDQHRAPGTS